MSTEDTTKQALSDSTSDNARRAAEPWRDAGGHAWEIRSNVECVECPHCAFTFASMHTVAPEDYDCPNCEGCPDFTAAPADNDAESVALIIPTCGYCPFIDHSGAFTPGGAKAICGHRNAVETFAANVEGDDRYHWKYRQVDREAAPPAQCPLRATTTKGVR